MEKEEVYKLIDEHYRQYRLLWIKKLVKRVGNVSNAKDIVQEGYYRACLYWTSFDTIQSFYAWMYTILNNATKDFYHAQYLNGMKFDQKVAHSIDPIIHVELKETLAAIERQCDNLRRVLWLTLILGYSSIEAAHIVPETANTIRKMVERFRKEIKHEKNDEKKRKVC